MGWLAPFALSLLVLVLRRPATVFTAEFWADDGPTFTQALDHGVASLGMGWGGSLIVVQRAILLVASWVPPVWAPVFANVVSLALTALVAAFIATRLPLGRPVRIGIAAAFVLLPGSDAIVGTASHIQWVTGAFLVAYAFARPGPRYELVAVFVAALTGPLALFVLPIYAVRWHGERSWFRPLAAVGAGAALQAVALLTNERMHIPVDLALVPEVLLTRTLGMPMLAGALTLVLVAIAGRTAPPKVQAAVWFLVLAIPLAGLLRATQPTAEFLVDAGARYFWLAPGLLAALVLVAQPSAFRYAALAALAIVFAAGLVMPAHPIAGWAGHAACIGGPVPCVVPVEPRAGWEDNWAVRWTPT